jgi:hypothetical protein
VARAAVDVVGGGAWSGCMMDVERVVDIVSVGSVCGRVC